jgi:hypothetical protein
VNVVGWSGRLRVFGGRLFFASRVGQEKCKQFNHLTGSVYRGRVISLRMKSHLLMMKVSRFCRVLGDAGRPIVFHRVILSDMKRGNK